MYPELTPHVKQDFPNLDPLPTLSPMRKMPMNQRRWPLAAPRHRAIIAITVAVFLVAAVLTVYFWPRSTRAVVEQRVSISVSLTPVQSAQEKGAVCLDGSTPQYHLDPGSGVGADSWLLYLEGGAWCGTVESCLERSRTCLGSSLYMEPQGFYGIMSSVPSENPDFYNWNRVVVRYCDGASFSGEGELEKNGTKLFFRGQRIWEAVMSDLMSKGLADAKKALLTGCSAGGLATFLHCDHFHELLPNVGTVKCLADAGFFLDATDISGKRIMHSIFEDVVHFQNVEKCLQKECISTAEPTQCFFPSEIIKHIATPIFVLNSAYDSWQVQNILAPDSSDPLQHWLRCKFNIQNCDAGQVQFLQGFRTSMLNSLKGFQNYKQVGMFIDSCFEHCQTLGPDVWHSPESPRINNKTIAEAVGDWFFDKREVKEVDHAYPCNSPCRSAMLDDI